MSKTIEGAEFDRRFDVREDMTEHVDWSRAKRLGADAKRVNGDFPPAILSQLDAHVRKRGVTRQALIKMWLADRLERAA